MANRGFEIVAEAERKNFDAVEVRGVKKYFYDEIIDPARDNDNSSQYNIYMPYTTIVPPRKTIEIYTDLRAYMKRNETLILTIAEIEGLVLTTGVQIHYGDLTENIKLSVTNMTGQGIEIEKDSIIAKAMFTNYLLTDTDIQLERVKP